MSAKSGRDLVEAIRKATEKSLNARDRYAEEVVRDLVGILSDTREKVMKSTLRYKTLGSLPENKLAALKGLKTLEKEIREIMGNLARDQSLTFRSATRKAFEHGIVCGVGDLVRAALPFYRDLKPDGIDKLAARVFTMIDTQALDFMINYNLTLAGDVQQELAAGIKRVILSGITTGKSVEDIARDMGRVVKDRESFRHAGGRVFSKAQYRMEMIARTEILRAHNQGRIKFYKHAGVKKLEWMSMDDERVCKVCGAFDGKVFDVDSLPALPCHPGCRCYVSPVDIDSIKS